MQAVHEQISLGWWSAVKPHWQLSTMLQAKTARQLSFLIRVPPKFFHLLQLEAAECLERANEKDPMNVQVRIMNDCE